MKKVTHKLIDIGANLTDPMFQGIYRDKKYHDSDFDLMLKRSFEQGVEKIIVTAGSLEESKQSIELTQKYGKLNHKIKTKKIRKSFYNCRSSSNTL